MINYYEILEVSEKASKEVIEKAYKTLAKKYHPDLNHDNTKEAEAKMKELNEAFDVLMDDSKRANFDNILEKKKALERQNQQKVYSNAKSQPSSISPNQTTYSNNVYYSKNGYYTDDAGNFYVDTHNMDEKSKKKLQAKLQEKYLEAYDAYLRQHGYKLKYKWTFKKIMQLILTILITIIIFVILFFIPPIHEYCINLYEENAVIKILVDIIASLFRAIFCIFQ